MIMNSGMNTLQEALKLYDDAHLLLVKSNWLEEGCGTEDFYPVRNRHLKSEFDTGSKMGNRVRNSTTVILSGVIPFVGCLLIGEIPDADALGYAVVGMMTTQPLISIIRWNLNSRRLHKSMHSVSLENRKYYANRVLRHLITYYPTNPLFDNDYIRGYAVWLEESYELLFKGAKSQYRKFFKEVGIRDFVLSEEFEPYLNEAQETNAYVARISKNKEESSLSFSANGISTAGAVNIVTMKPLDSANKSPKKPSVMDDRKYDTKIEDSPKPKMQDFSADMKILKTIEKEWLDTQSDITKILKFPMFSDIREPLVQSFHTKLSVAQSFASKELTDNFVLTISELKTSWSLLCYEARRVEISNFDIDERRKIIKASDLMNIALNVASSPSERQSAYRKAMEQLKGLVAIPELAMQSIEHAVSRQELVA